MARKETTQRIMDAERGTVGGAGQVTAAVSASGPAVGSSPPPTGLAIDSQTLVLSAQTPMVRMNLSWRRPLGAQEVRLYQVQVATDSSFTTGITYVNASDVSVSIDVVTNTAGIAYWFRVRVLSGGIVSDWSNVVTATALADTTPAGLPTSVAYDWSGGDLVITWVNPTDSNLKDVEVRIWNSSGKTVLYHTGFSASGRYVWTLPQQRIDTAGVLDSAVYFELRSRTWSNVLGTSTAGVSPTNSVPSAPSAVAFIQSPGSITISVAATIPSDFLSYRYRIIQTLPSASDVTFDSPSALTAYSLYAQATYQVGVKVQDVYGQLSSETLSSASIVDTLTIGALRADVIYSDNDGNSDATLHIPLSNDNLSSSGITYATTASWNKWVRAERPMLDRYRTMTISMVAASGVTEWYVRLSADGTNWTYYSSPVTASRILTLVANAAAAQAAAISAGFLSSPTTSRVELPANVEARFIEVWFRNPTPANTTVYEFYPRRVVEADDIKVQNLAAISADVGSITAGTITGVLIQTATSGARVKLDSTGLTTYDSAGTVQVTATTSTNGVFTAGAGAVAIDKNGVRIESATTGGLGSPVAKNSIELVTGALVDGYVFNTNNISASPFPQQDMIIAATGNYIKTISTDARNRLTMIASSVAGGASTTIQLQGSSGLEAAAITLQADTTLLGVLSINNAGATASIDVGTGGGANHYALLDLIGDGTYTDYGLRMVRGNGGANATSDILHRGTGAFSLFTTEAGAIQFGTTNALRMTIGSSGAIAVGTTPNTTVRLLVEGASAAAAAYALLVRNSTPANLMYIENNGNLWANVAWTVSDEREKEDITDADVNLIDILDGLRVRKYKRTINGEYELGLIAQEVATVYPSAVKAGLDGILGIRQGDILALLVAAFKREKAIVRNLRTRIIALEAK